MTKQREALRLTLTDMADTRTRALIVNELDRFNEERTGVAHSTPLDVLLVDAADVVIGGLVGRTSLGVLFVDYFYVPPSLRGQGHGRRALSAAEDEAVRRGCREALLFTMQIQAPGFYERCGYASFGRIECDPPGNARIFMRKALTAAGSGLHCVRPSSHRVGNPDAPR
jgi:GNAT superfamily N-acetyltransferase